MHRGGLLSLVAVGAAVGMTGARAGELTSTRISSHVRCPKGQGTVPPTLELIFEPRYTHTEADTTHTQPTWRVRDDRVKDAHFLVRRFRMVVYGDFSRDWAYYFKIRRESGMDSFDWSDAYVTYGGWDLADLTLGQFKTPTERSTTVSEMKFPLYERPRSAGVLGTERDWGLMIHDERRSGGRYGWKLGIFNGDGMNRPHSRSSVLLTGRVDYAATPSLTLGVGCSHNNNTYGNRYRAFLKSNKDPYCVLGLYKAGAVDEEVWTLDAHYEDEHARVFAGYLRLDLSGPQAGLPAADDWYLIGGWKIPCHGDPEGLEAVLGIEGFDANTSVSDVLDARFYTIGFNWRPHGTKKGKSFFDQLRVQYCVRDERGAPDVANDSLVFEYDMSWKY